MKTEQRSDNRDGPNPRERSQSAGRALAVLDLLADSAEPRGVREIARQLNLASSIVQRLVTTLLDFDYVERAPDGVKYRIGYRAFQVGHSYVSRSDLHAASLPELRRMAEHDQVNAYLGVLRDGAVVYLEALQSKGPIAITSTPGARGWLHSTAFGKALLAELPDNEVAALLGTEPFHRLTAKTKVACKELINDIQSVRRLGYAVSDEENIDNVFAAGAAIRDWTGQTVAAISGALPRNQMRNADIENLCRLVADAAQRISQRLGAPPAVVWAHTAREGSRSGKAENQC